jgi:hypothetical protein
MTPPFRRHADKIIATTPFIYYHRLAAAAFRLLRASVRRFRRYCR